MFPCYCSSIMKLDKGVLYSWGSQKSVSVVDILKVSLEKAGWMYFNAGISFTVESECEKRVICILIQSVRKLRSFEI